MADAHRLTPASSSPSHDDSQRTPRMTSPCTLRGASTALTRTGAMVVVFGLAFGPAAAYAQADVPTTVQAIMGGDGAVSDVKVFGSDGKAPAADELPVKVGISQSVDGDAATVSYNVENTSVTKKAVTYTDAAGKTATVDQDVALPLVAQLSVRVPASRTDVSAPGARVTRLADGSHELVWSLVLFNPIGAPVADVSYTAKGTGDPVARLDAAVVNPNATPGLAATAQAANATVNGNGILGTIGQGASEGLVKLSDGVGKLLAGLDKLEAGAIKLNEGIDKAQVGAVKLADGSEAAKAGSGKLVVGLDQIADGAGQLSTGAKQLYAGTTKLDAGAGKISDGLGAANEGGEKLAVGSGQLATGATAAAVGARSLADGLALISGGLGQLSDVKGLPAALDGAERLRAAVEQLRAGLGSPTTAGTILNGLAQIGGGLTQVKGGLDGLGSAAGLPAAKGGVDQVAAGLNSALAAGGAIDQLSGGVSRAKGDVDQAMKEASCPTPTSSASATVVMNGSPCDELLDASGVLARVSGGFESNGKNDPQPSAQKPTGLRRGLTDAAGGLGQVSGGLATAIAGVGQLATGVATLQAGNTAVTAGVNQVAAGLKSGDPAKPGIAEGLDGLVVGLTTAVAGIGQLSDGAKTAATGSVALAEGNAAIAAGAGQLATGNAALSSGLSQLFTGSKELTAGTGALDAGAGKIADGLGKLAPGAQAAATGAGQLDEGLGKIAVGQRQVADGLPAAVDGSGQLADGLGQVNDGQGQVDQGIKDVRTKAVEVLRSQFAQGTTLARQQLAGLDASTALASETPGAVNTTYVLTQDADGIVANLASGSSDDGGSNTGRNVALGAGGALLLLGGIAGGYLSGRRQPGA